MWRIFKAILITLVFFHDACVAELPPNYSFMHEATQAPNISFYDYIVVGGGATGIPLATTLSENHTVLLLERGGSPYNNPDVTIAANFGNYFYDSSPSSPVEQFMSKDGVGDARPRVLGGGTTLNAGFYTRDSDKFLKEAKLTDEKLVNDSYEYVEKVMVFDPELGEWQLAWKTALIDAGVTPENGFTYDYFPGIKVSGSTFDKNGQRHTAAELMKYANPLMLSVYLYATVTKILFTTQGRTTPKAYAVVFEDTYGNKHTAYLKGDQTDEIILSAGPLGSPQLLMLSGIGPKDQLDALQIKVVLDQPLVGHGVIDNPLNVLFIPSPIPLNECTVQVTGTLTSGQIEPISAINLVSESPSDCQGFSYQSGGFVMMKVDDAISTGELKLQSSNPVDSPSVKFNYISEPEDLKKCVNGMGIALKVIESKALSKYKYANMTIQDILDLTIKLPTYLPVHADTSSSLEQFCKDTVRTLWEFHGGCQVGKVVDDDYKVIGVDALRVIDGSAILNGPASLMMIAGRYMGVTIKANRLATEISKSGLKFSS